MSKPLSRFDSLVRSLGGAASRRAVLSALLAGAVAPLARPTESEARRRRGKRKTQQPGRQNRQQSPGEEEQGLSSISATCDVCASGCPYSSLQPAIDAAASGATILICAGTYRSNPTITVNKPLRLVGDGADRTILQGGGFVRVMLIGPSGVVTMRGLAIEGGVEPQKQRGGGAGILVLDRGALTLDNCRVESNLASEGGGIVVSPAASVTLIDSDVSSNTAYAIGGGLLVRRNGRATLETGSRIGDNAANVLGGGVFLEDRSVLTAKSTSRIEENNARFNGGGIYASQGSTAALEAGSLVTENGAGDTGGGVFNDRATVTIADTSIVVDNEPNNCGGSFGTQTENCAG